MVAVATHGVGGEQELSSIYFYNYFVMTDTIIADAEAFEARVGVSEDFEDSRCISEWGLGELADIMGEDLDVMEGMVYDCGYSIS